LLVAAAAVSGVVLAAGCSSSPSGGSSGGGTASAANASTATSVAAFGGTNGLVAACKKEGTLNVITLPANWANYGTIMKDFTAKYGIKINDANPDGSSQDEINAMQQLKGQSRAPDVLDMGTSFAIKADQAQLRLVGGEGQRRDRAETGAGHLLRDLRPPGAGTQREFQLATGRAAAHPDQPEVADARAPRDGLPLQVDDVAPKPAGLQRVHHPEHAAPDHHHPFHLPHPSWPGSRQSIRRR
jgi:hypothetical protein